MKWIEQPQVSWDIGRQILLHQGDWKRFVGLDYKANMREISWKLNWVNEKKRKERVEKKERKEMGEKKERLEKL